ncbi:MAG: hypothetical protein GY807_11690 [Gammaproteobacteria bacterium]|nr:hypothetical protein [Gammaproteobacteria bacterium]
MTIAETLITRGKTEGITEGITKGKTEATETMALNLFGEGMSLDFVARVTALPTERLSQLQQELPHSR